MSSRIDLTKALLELQDDEGAIPCGSKFILAVTLLRVAIESESKDYSNVVEVDKSLIVSSALHALAQSIPDLQKHVPIDHRLELLSKASVEKSDSKLSSDFKVTATLLASSDVLKHIELPDQVRMILDTHESFVGFPKNAIAVAWIMKCFAERIISPTDAVEVITLLSNDIRAVELIAYTYLEQAIRQSKTSAEET